MPDIESVHHQIVLIPVPGLQTVARVHEIRHRIIIEKSAPKPHNFELPAPGLNSRRPCITAAPLHGSHTTHDYLTKPPTRMEEKEKKRKLTDIESEELPHPLQ
jgi:hypothetical protein